jgi:protoporphyrinogen oxidase
MGANEPRKTVAVIGTGMAGLVTAYILRNDAQGRYDVEVFEKV